MKAYNTLFLALAATLVFTACGDFDHNNPNANRDANFQIDATNTAIKVTAEHEVFGDKANATSADTKTGDVFTAEFSDLLVGKWNFTVTPKDPADAEKFETMTFSATLESGDNDIKVITLTPVDGGGDVTIPPEDLHLDTLAADGNTAAGELNSASQKCEDDTPLFTAGTVTEATLVEDIGNVEAVLVTATTAFNALSAALNKAEGRDDIEAAVITTANEAKDALQAAITRAHKALEAGRQAIRNAHDPDDPIDPDMNGRVNICVRSYNGNFVTVRVSEISQGLNEDLESTGCFTFTGLPKRLDLQFDIFADGYKTHRTPVVKIEGAEVPSINATLQPDVVLNEGDLYLGTAGIVVFNVFIGDPEPLPLTSLGVWQQTSGKLELLAPGSYSCAHEGMIDRVTVPADCSQMTAGSEAGCEAVTIDAGGGHTIDFHGRAIDMSGGGSPADWDRGPDCQ